MKPRHPAGSRAVTLHDYRYESGGWVYRLSASAGLENRLGFSRCVETVFLTESGRWRICAYHRDVDHTATHSGRKYVTVK